MVQKQAISLESLQQRLAVARGDHPAETLLVNCKMVNVYAGSIVNTNIAIYDGYVCGFGDYAATDKIDLKGKYLLPGFIEGHIHVESSKLTPKRFAEVVSPHGTTAVVADPHEIANVHGIAGIEFMLADSENLPVDIFYMIPSCVPATHMETAGAVLSASDLEPLYNHPRIIGLAEMMNYPGAYLGLKPVLEKLICAKDVPIDGHAPGLSGKNLSAYIISGPLTDHECTTLSEAKEKLDNGMRIMIREGSTAKNLEALLPLINKYNARRIMFVSDDKRPGDLIEEGHLDNVLRKAVKLGLDPMEAIRMVTINTAETFRLFEYGAIFPGGKADLVALHDLHDFRVDKVIKNGKLVVDNGRFISDQSVSTELVLEKSMNLKPVTVEKLQVPKHTSTIRVIEIIPDQIVTAGTTFDVSSQNDFLTSDVEKNVLKIAVIERYSGQGNMSIGFVRGMGLKRGALASTVAHDSHNIIVVGVDDISMITAANRLIEIGGGQIAVNGERVLAELPLPIGGLMSDQSPMLVSKWEHNLFKSARELGTQLNDPLMALSFLALPVIPELKLTDKGLVDVNRFEFTSLFVD